MEIKLKNIVKKYDGVKYNTANFAIGGGKVDGFSFSNRHQDASSDIGKLSLGQVTALFKRATGLDTATIKAVITICFPVLEWHHAGVTPNGKMKKTFFLNSTQIVELASNFDKYLSKLEKENNREAYKEDFLKKNATFLERVAKKPSNFLTTKEEMQGKYGWFKASHYNLPVFYTGWKFASEEAYMEYKNIM